LLTFIVPDMLIKEIRVAELLIYAKPVNKDIDTSTHFEQGDIIEALSDQHIQFTWFELLVRQTHGYSDIPFIPDLYKKYYKRLILTKDKKLIEDKNPVSNFRGASKNPNIRRAYDQELKPLTFPLTSEMQEEIFKYFSYIEKNSAFGDRKLFQYWHFGQEEIRNFLPIYIPDSEFNYNDNIIRNLKDPLIDEKENILKKRKYYIDYQNKLEELELNYTAKQVIENYKLPIKLQNYLITLINRGYINAGTTLLEIIHDSRIPFYNRFISTITKNVISSKKMEIK